MPKILSREVINERKRNWYARNREGQKQLARKLYQKSPERYKYHRAAALANKRYPGPRLTANDIADIVASSGRICHWCKKDNLTGGDITLEHLQPTNDRSSLAIACLSCNSARQHSIGRRTTSDEQLAKQRASEKKSRRSHAEIDRLVKAAYYLQNTDAVKAKARARYAKYREQILDHLRQKYAGDPEFKAAMKQRVREWEQENPERTKELKRDWYERNKAPKELQDALLQVS